MAVDRGHHKVFLGMAAGVGKTYRMLQEGQAEAEAGRDVVIGYLEPHGRAETIALAEGLRSCRAAAVDLPRRRRSRRWTCRRCCARAPELALIDELAHTNAPGLEHEKRYEDVDDVLAAGIDVFSTVNVQHLESLNDQVAELTGARVRETIPDAVLGEADEVVLIDLTPEALIERLRAGKIYPGENDRGGAQQLLHGSRTSPPCARSALRQVAEEVEAKRLVVEEPLADRATSAVAADAPQAVGERLLALVRPQPSLAAARPPGLALGAAARHRPRPALGEAAGPPIEGEVEPGDGAAPPRLGARRHLPDRGERRPVRGVARRSASAGPPT